MRIRKSVVLVATVAALLTGCTATNSGSSESASTPNLTTGAPTAAEASPDVSASRGSAPATPATLPSGFPQSLFPVMQGAILVNATIEPAKATDGTATLSMVLTSGATPPDTLAFYDKAIIDQGFTVTTQNNGDNTFSRDYVRADGKESVNLSINWPSNVVTVTIGANLLQSSVK